MIAKPEGHILERVPSTTINITTQYKYGAFAIPLDRGQQLEFILVAHDRDRFRHPLGRAELINGSV